MAICGPKSSPVIAHAIDADPYLSFTAEESGRWLIRDRHSGQAFASPLDEPDSQRWADLAYLARLKD